MISCYRHGYLPATAYGSYPLHMALPPAARAFVEEAVESAPPMSDQLRDDLRLIIWSQPAPDKAA